MFLGWIAREGLLVPETGADPLAVYSPDARKAVCRAVVSDVAASPARLLAATATEPQLAWCLACLGHALTLPLAPSPGELAAATAAAGSSNSAKEAAHQVLTSEIPYTPPSVSAHCPFAYTIPSSTILLICILPPPTPFHHLPLFLLPLMLLPTTAGALC